VLGMVQNERRYWGRYETLAHGGRCRGGATGNILVIVKAH
jgi:hypothetical protein